MAIILRRSRLPILRRRRGSNLEINLETMQKKITAVVALGTLGFSAVSGAYYWLHVRDIETLEENTIPPRITQAMDVRCQALAVGNDPTLLEENVIEPLRSRYKELTGREFGYGECRDGHRVSKYAIKE